jgi:hypothetical protein
VRPVSPLYDGVVRHRSVSRVPTARVARSITVGAMGYQVEKSDEEWRAELTPEEYAVLRKAGTERPFVGEYTDT